MKIQSIVIGKLLDDPRKDHQVQILCSAHDLSHHNFFARKAVKEISMAIAKTILPLLEYENFTTVQHEGINLGGKKFSDEIVILIATVEDYPTRIVRECISEIRAIFDTRFDVRTIGDTVKFDDLDEILKKYNNPTKFDALLKASQQVETAKEKVNESIKKLLENQENLESIINSTEDMSRQSKEMFATATKFKNSTRCCSIQ